MNDILQTIWYGSVLTLVELLIAIVCVSLERSEELNRGSAVRTLGRFYVMNILFIVILSNIPAG